MEILLIIGLIFVVIATFEWIISTDHERKQIKRNWNGCLFLLVVGVVFFFVLLFFSL